MAETEKTKVKETVAVEEVRLDKKVMVRSIAPWLTGTSRKTSMGDITIPPKGSILLTREEIIAQAQNGNRLLTGLDALGSHATWYIEDSFTREELTFDTESKKQTFLSEDTIKRIFDLKTQKAFEENIKSNVVTRAEKAYLLECIKSLGINDYKKIAFCVEYTGMKM